MQTKNLPWEGYGYFLEPHILRWQGIGCKLHGSDWEPECQATHPHLQLNRNSIPSPPHRSILWCTIAQASRGYANHVFLVYSIKAIKAHIVQINNKKQMISWLCQQPMMLNIYPRLKRYLQLWRQVGILLSLFKFFKVQSSPKYSPFRIFFSSRST